MSECEKCNGMGELCDACDEPPNPAQTCDTCGGLFCAISRGSATRVSDGAKVDIGHQDCFTGHECIPVEPR